MSAVSENMTKQFEIKENDEFNENFVEVDDQNEQKEDIESKNLSGEGSKGVLNSSNGSSGIGSLIGSPNCDLAANNSTYAGYSSGNDCSNQQDSNDCSQSVKINANAPSFNSARGANFQVPMELMNKLSLNQNIQNNNSTDNLSNLDEAEGNQMYSSAMNYHSLPIGMGNNSQFEYDLFNSEFSGVDKQLAMHLANQNVLDAVIGNKKNMEHQKQLLAQAIAAANLLTQNSQNSGNNENKNRSIMENIDQLNSKFLNQKQSQDQNIQKNFNSLLAAASSFNQNSTDQMGNFNSPSSMKRQSTGAFLNSNAIFSTPIQPSTSPTNSNSANISNNNNRFSEANRFYSKQSNQSNSPEKMNSMSASNSSFNIEMANNNPNASVNSAYEDDEVFSQNSSLNFSQQSGNSQLPGSNQNIDMYQLYRTLLASNLNSSNISELLMNQSPNLSNLSIGSVTDILNSNNSNNFLNLSNLNNSFNQSKMNNFSQGNNSGQGSNFNQNNMSNAAFAAAFFKQRQNNQMMNNRSSSSYMGGQSNNLNQTNLAQFLSPQNQQMINNDPKRRVNSIATAYNFGSSSNNSPLFSSASTHNVGPNASHLLQQSSLVSSAPFISSAANQSTASVLGNNSPLSQTISSLQNQSNPMMSNLENFASINSSPLQNSNHLMSFSSSGGSPLSNTLLSSSGKPLRSERLPPQMVEEIIKQAKIRRKQGGKKEVCVFCRNNGEKEQFFASHTLKDAQNNVACPVLRLYQCPICHANGDQAHTIKYCPYAEKDSPKLKEFSRLSAATALFLNSLNTGGSTPPNSSPPETPSPLNQTPSQSHRLSFLSQGISPNISSPNNAFAQALQFGNFNNFNLSNACLQGKTDLNMNVNKASNELNNGLLTASGQANIK